MPTLSIEQIAGYASAAGLSGEPLAISTAIGMAESHGDTDARGDTRLQSSTWGPSIGIWQIRSLNAQRNTGGLRDEVANLNPSNNARAMFAISEQGRNWHAWTAYNSGEYRAFLAAARLAANSPAMPSGNASTGGVNLLDGGTWARVGLFVFGGLILAFALYKATGAGIPTNISSIVKAVK